MNVESLIGRLDRFAEALPAVVAGIPGADARWRPPEGGWSILEIVTHLADEEVEDFPARLKLTLRDPELEWPPVDPEESAVQRRYNEGNLDEAVGRFVSARRDSVKWLRGLREPDWSITHHHEVLGDLRGGDLLAAWVAHDALHLRQIAKRLFQLTGRDAGEYGTAYAGSWG